MSVHDEQRLREGSTLSTRHSRWGRLDLWYFSGDESGPAEFAAQRWSDDKVTTFPTFGGLIDRLDNCTDKEWED